MIKQVKNKAPAAIQITAEQLIREAKERELEVVPPPPNLKISDTTELKEYQLRKRKEFEDNLRRNRNNVSHWLKYAKWEENQACIDRARSIFERALDTTGSRNITIWLKYLEMEMTNRQVKHARTLFDRAVYILPRVNQFWYKYVYFEEILGNISACRAIFERWIKFLPGEQEWQTYINFEMRYKEVDRAREIYSKYVMLHPEVKIWIKFAKFEERHSDADNARQVYELALEFFGDAKADDALYIEFAQFEERQFEYERVKLIYDYALKKLPKEKAYSLYEQFATFQKKHGALKDIEDLISQKRKEVYETKLKESPRDYDTWFDYIKLAEDEFSLNEIRDIYERAVACVPESRTDKEEWRRYIHLWLYYATFEEVDICDKKRASEVYDFCLNQLIPHDEFTFAKVWLAAAKLQLRLCDINKAREILDRSISLCPKRKLFKEYIEIEIQLHQFDRCRKLYQKFLQRAPEDSSVWINYAELEAAILQSARARAIYRLAINRTEMDSPELVWKAFIDFEIELLNKSLEEGNVVFENESKVLDEYKKVEDLYEDLLERTNHVKVWLNYSKFYINLIDTLKKNKLGLRDDEEEVRENIDKIVGRTQLKARQVFERANERLRDEEALSRVVLLEAWQEFESQLDDGLDISAKMPNKVKKRKRIELEADCVSTLRGVASVVDYEEYYEYEFPEAKKKKTELMDLVKKWKESRQEASV